MRRIGGWLVAALFLAGLATLVVGQAAKSPHAAARKSPPVATVTPSAAAEPTTIGPQATVNTPGAVVSRDAQSMTRDDAIDLRRELALAAVNAASGAETHDDIIDQGGKRYLAHHVEFWTPEDCQKFNVPGAHVFNRFDRFADIFVVADFLSMVVLNQVRAAPGFRWEEFATNVAAPPPQLGARSTSRAVKEDIVQGGLGDLTGKGVIIAIVDTGLDFRNPDFITYDAQAVPTSRLRYFWDTTSEFDPERGLGQAAPVSFPNGTSIGTLYSQGDLNKELRSLAPLIPVWDIDGHGTACAGVAAGNGNNSKGEHVGVAPEADIIGVRLGDSLESAYLLNAICGWVDRVAQPQPAIISCSFGGKDGGHDGMRIEERQLSARFPPSIRGRALCIAAGNGGKARVHAELNFAGSDKYDALEWSTTTSNLLAIYYDTADEKDLRYAVTSGPSLSERGQVNAVTGKYVSFFNVPAGDSRVEFYTASGKQVKADAFLYGSDAARNSWFEANCVSYTMSVETPGSALNAITVGSYDWNDQFHQYGKLGARTDPINGDPLTIGALSTYSGVGPLRDGGTLKPDIVAPGQYYAASASRNTRAIRDTSGQYKLFNGTSAATPYTAGVLALLMQKKPHITLAEIKQLLATCGSQDRFTGPLPNAKWGHGKLNLAAVEKMLERINDGDPPEAKEE